MSYRDFFKHRFKFNYVSCASKIGRGVQNMNIGILDIEHPNQCVPREIIDFRSTLKIMLGRTKIFK